MNFLYAQLTQSLPNKLLVNHLPLQFQSMSFDVEPSVCPVSINKPENKSGCSISNYMIDCKLPVNLVSVNVVSVSPVSNYEPEREMSTSPVSLNESDVEPCVCLVSINECDKSTCPVPINALDFDQSVCPILSNVSELSVSLVSIIDFDH